ncbi:dnaJsubfamily B member 1 [Dorcoceras hygrometricum]|uniref:DnaJsubfamily B member 1 n=1 Tax=Dorcoceras hygrometricum TaxID=472368 RepID=A0A2Z7BH09_9LAMI|nr:dnaJsubfamily B member 1 [Dorcoceras hygrometricum]
MAIDYYSVLELSRNATNDDVKKSYRRLAMIWHPDKHFDKQEAEAKFKQISEAYRVLSEPDKRQIYDSYGEGGFNQCQFPPPPHEARVGFSSIGQLHSSPNFVFSPGYIDAVNADIFGDSSCGSASCSVSGNGHFRSPAVGCGLKNGGLKQEPWFLVNATEATSGITSISPDRWGNCSSMPEHVDDANGLPIPPYGARWKRVFTRTHAPNHSVRIIRDVLDKMEDDQAWGNRYNLIVESSLHHGVRPVEKDYMAWYERITRRFISPNDLSDVEYGYRPGDAYFRSLVKDQASILMNLFQGLSLEDQPCGALVAAVNDSIRIGRVLYQMASRMPNPLQEQGQQQQQQQRNPDMHSEDSRNKRHRGQSLSSS